MPSRNIAQVWFSPAEISVAQLAVPHFPEQPSSHPHGIPVQLGTHAPEQWPELLHVSVNPQLPQEPPQPLVPHSRSTQSGVQLAAQWPELLHVAVNPQLPQEPPQPLEPHSRSTQSGVQDTQSGSEVHVASGQMSSDTLSHSHIAPLTASSTQMLPSGQMLKDNQPSKQEIPFMPYAVSE